MCSFVNFNQEETHEVHKTSHEISGIDKFIIKSQEFVRMAFKEINKIYKFISNKLFLTVLLAFLFAEISFYQILFREEIGIDNCFHSISIIFGVGYYIGTLFLKFLKISDYKFVIYGIFLSVICLVTLYVMDIINIKNHIVHLLFFGIYSLGFALFVPSLFSAVSKKISVHEQGLLCGILDSTDTVAMIVAFFLVSHFQQVSCAIILLISTILLIMSSGYFYELLKGEATYE